MKTVRLSSNLRYDIQRAAEAKFNKANPKKDYPSDGMQLFIDEGYQLKIDKTVKHFKDVWGFDMATTNARELVISSSHYVMDEDGDEEERDKSYTLTLPDIPVPNTLLRYGDSMRVQVEPDNATFLACVEIEMYNSKLSDNLYSYRNNIRQVLDRFTTLNQLIKAAPYMKDLVPQERLQKMHEVDDRSGRRAQQAELADNELSELREVLLEDALLGDD